MRTGLVEVSIGLKLFFTQLVHYLLYVSNVQHYCEFIESKDNRQI